jgi:hypothetical protein
MENKNYVVVVLIVSLKMRVGEKINKTGPSHKRERRGMQIKKIKKFRRKIAFFEIFL